MARMLGRMRGSMCPVCRVEPGPDCGDKGKDKRTCRRIEHRQWLHEALEGELEWQHADDPKAGTWTDLITFPDPPEQGTIWIR